MRAIFTTRYGSPEVLEVRDAAMPKVGDDDVLVRVFASAITAGDRRLRAAAYPNAFMSAVGRLIFGVFKPRNPIQGAMFAGRVVAVGANITRLSVGDDVFGSSMAGGASAEYLAVKGDSAIAAMPAGYSYEEAAALPYGADTALVFLQDMAKVAAGEKVLIIGAAGGVGRFGIQVAKERGATVTAVCSRSDFDLVRSLGADEVIDYRTEDFTTNGKRYDVIFDSAMVTSYGAIKGSLSTTGRFASLAMTFGSIFRGLFNRMTGGHRIHVGVAMGSAEGMERIRRLAEEGAIRPVVALSLPISQVVEAHRQADSGKHHGEILVTMPEAATLRAVA